MQATVSSLLLALCLCTTFLLTNAFVLTPSATMSPTVPTPLCREDPTIPPPPATTGTGTTTGPNRPGITAAPQPGDAGLAAPNADDAARFRQTTYWSCMQWPGETTAHCGWHEPILDASMSNGAGRGRGGLRRIGVVGAVALVGALLAV